MNRTLAAQVRDLAESLQNLRRRFRQAARYEVARAVAEALHDAAMTLVCGPAPLPARPRTPDSGWEDPWNDPMEDPWRHAAPSAVDDTEDNTPPPMPHLSPALLTGVGAARWAYTRCRQIGPAVLLGLLVALAATLGGPTVKEFLRAWSVANNLLSQTYSDHAL
jgi:hypothetical protein